MLPRPHRTFQLAGLLALVSACGPFAAGLGGGSPMANTPSAPATTPDAATGGDGTATSFFGVGHAPIALLHSSQTGGNLCVQAAGSKQADGAGLQLASCANVASQSFQLANGYVALFGSTCVGSAGDDANGSPLQLGRCDAADSNMRWDVVGSHLRRRGTDKCLNVTNRQFDAGTPLELWTCDDLADGQAFRFGGTAANNANATSEGNAPAQNANVEVGSKTPSTVAPSSGTLLALNTWQQEVHAAKAFNNEQQNYTDGNKNVDFGANGTTTITAYPTGGSTWSSARLSGAEMGPLPWYLEADLEAPTGKGSWPAFWLTARSSWPQGGEVDVMEQVNGSKESHVSTHWGQQTGVPSFNTHEVLTDVDGGQRHRYGVWATAAGLQFYLDGKAVGSWVTFPSAANFSAIAAKMVPIVNVAMGGDWPGSAPQNTGNQVMRIYAVRRDDHPPAK